MAHPLSRRSAQRRSRLARVLGLAGLGGASCGPSRHSGARQHGREHRSHRLRERWRQNADQLQPFCLPACLLPANAGGMPQGGASRRPQPSWLAPPSPSMRLMGQPAPWSRTLAGSLVSCRPVTTCWRHAATTHDAGLLLRGRAPCAILSFAHGDVAQLGERDNRTVEVRGSSPLVSTEKHRRQRLDELPLDPAVCRDPQAVRGTAWRLR